MVTQLNSILNSFLQRNDELIVLGPAEDTGTTVTSPTDDSVVGEEEVLVSTSTSRPIYRAPDADNEQASYCRGAGRGSKFGTENKGFSSYRGRPY